MRNILAYVPQKDKEKVAAKLKLIWKAPDEKSARAMKNDFCEEYEKAFPKAVECLEEGFEDSVQFYAFEKLDSRKTSSTNTLERLNREIRRRSSVVGIFPSTDSYIRLITSYLLEYSEDWQTERCYINAGSIKVQKEILFKRSMMDMWLFSESKLRTKFDTIVKKLNIIYNEYEKTFFKTIKDDWKLIECNSLPKK